MKFAGSVACFLVSLDCVDKASGAQPQMILSGSALWPWWIVAMFWAVSGARLLADA